MSYNGLESPVRCRKWTDNSQNWAHRMTVAPGGSGVPVPIQSALWPWTFGTVFPPTWVFSLSGAIKRNLYYTRSRHNLGQGLCTKWSQNNLHVFQFLEQRYGFFHCKKCNIRWESAYVWCISGTSKVSWVHPFTQQRALPRVGIPKIHF